MPNLRLLSQAIFMKHDHYVVVRSIRELINETPGSKAQRAIVTLWEKKANLNIGILDLINKNIHIFAKRFLQSFYNF